jgi:hypothetical protein
MRKVQQQQQQQYQTVAGLHFRGEAAVTEVLVMHWQVFLAAMCGLGAFARHLAQHHLCDSIHTSSW